MSGWLEVSKVRTYELDDCEWVWVSGTRLYGVPPLPPTHAELMAKEMAERKAWCACRSERLAMARNDFDAPSSQPGRG